MTAREEIYGTVRLGDVVNFDSSVAWYNFPMKFFYAELHRASRKKFPGSKRTNDIHSVLVLDFKADGTPLVLSVTVPHAVIEPLKVAKRTKKITICRQKGAEKGFPLRWINEMRNASKDILGTGYDYGQILAIKLRLQGWPKWIANWFDRDKKRTVCSGGVQYCLLRAWKKLNGTSGIAQPLAGVAPSGTYPAHFANHSSSFDIVLEKRKPKGGWNRG